MHQQIISFLFLNFACSDRVLLWICWWFVSAPLIHLWLMALYKCIYLLTYLLICCRCFLPFQTTLQFTHMTITKQRWRFDGWRQSVLPKWCCGQFISLAWTYNRNKRELVPAAVYAARVVWNCCRIYVISYTFIAVNSQCRSKRQHNFMSCCYCCCCCMFVQGGRKNWHHFCTPWLYQMLTDFQNYFTVRISRKFVIILSLKIPPLLKCVATLPCEMSCVLKQQFENKMISVATYFKKLATINNVFIVSVIV